MTLWVGGPFGAAEIKATVLPEVTTSRLVCGESSIEVIAVGKGMLPTTACDLRSHHLRLSVSCWIGQVGRGYTLDNAVFSGRDPKIFGYPDDTLDGPLVGQAIGVFQKVWRGVGAVDVKNPGLFLLAAGEEMRRG